MTPGAQRAKIARPSGPNPKHKRWDGDKGAWVDDPNNPPPAKKSVGRPRKRAAGSAEDERPAQRPAAAETAAQPRPTTERHTRKFQTSWKTVLPWIIFVAGLGVAVEICPSLEGEKCPGCPLCGRMMCTLCMERNTRGMLRGDDAKNPFVAGCSRFKIGSCREHASIYHNADMDARQRTVSEGFAKQFADMREHLRHVFKNVYWLSKQKIALWKLPEMCELDRCKGYPMMRTYCTHVMAREMLMSLAHVIREGINEAACASAAVALMVDESTDVSQTGAMVLYLRLNIGGVFKTVFWGLVECADATSSWPRRATPGASPTTGRRSARRTRSPTTPRCAARSRICSRRTST
jgi:hypothetical protein